MLDATNSKVHCMRRNKKCSVEGFALSIAFNLWLNIFSLLAKAGSWSDVFPGCFSSYKLTSISKSRKIIYGCSFRNPGLWNHAGNNFLESVIPVRSGNQSLELKSTECIQNDRLPLNASKIAQNDDSILLFTKRKTIIIGLAKNDVENMLALFLFKC